MHFTRIYAGLLYKNTLLAYVFEHIIFQNMFNEGFIIFLQKIYNLHVSTTRSFFRSLQPFESWAIVMRHWKIAMGEIYKSIIVEHLHLSFTNTC